MKTHTFLLFLAALFCPASHAINLASVPTDIYPIHDRAAPLPASKTTIAAPVSSAHTGDSTYFIANYDHVYFCSDQIKSCSMFEPVFPASIPSKWNPTKLTWHDGKLFIANYKGNNILIGRPDFSAHSIKIIDQMASPDTLGPEGLALSDDGKWLVSANSDGDTISFFHNNGRTWTQAWTRRVPFAHGVDIDGDNVYITSLVDRKIILFSLKTGAEISRTGTTGWDAKELGMLWPTSIIKHDNGVVITDAHTGRVSLLNSDLTVNTWFGCNGAGAANLNMPYSSEVYNGRLYVLSTFQNRLLEMDLSKQRMLRSVSFGPSINVNGDTGACVGASYDVYTNTTESIETPFGRAQLGYRTLSAPNHIIDVAHGLFNPVNEFYFLQAVKLKSVDGVVLFSPQFLGGEVYLPKQGLLFSLPDIPANSWSIDGELVTPNGNYDLVALESRIKQRVKKIGSRPNPAFSPDEIHATFFGDAMSKDTFYGGLNLSFISRAGKKYWADYQAGRASAQEYYKTALTGHQVYLSEFVLVGLLSGNETPPEAIWEIPARMAEAARAYNEGNFSAALTKLHPLADAGVAEAETLLGFMYDNGNGVPLDYKQAVNWYRKAAERGHANAQYNLGMMYGKGLGIAQDFVHALKWFKLAALAGYGDANEAIKRAEALMTPAQIKQANRNVHAWRKSRQP